MRSQLTVLDQLFQPVRDVIVSVLVHIAHISGPVEAIGRKDLLVQVLQVVVALEHVGALKENLS
jgi:hypothetical protein